MGGGNKKKEIKKNIMETIYVTNNGKETFQIVEKEKVYEIYSNVFGESPATTYDKKDWTYDEVVEDLLMKLRTLLNQKERIMTK